MVLERWRPRWGITPWRPFREIEDFLGRPMWQLPVDEKGWTPSVDVFEKDDKFVVKVELPGMKEDDIDVSVIGDMLNIKGEKKEETEVKEEDYYRCERTYGSFYRSIPLPSTLDTSKVEANFEDGVLEVTLPKSAEAKPKKIAVAAKKKANKAVK